MEQHRRLPARRHRDQCGAARPRGHGRRAVGRDLAPAGRSAQRRSDVAARPEPPSGRLPPALLRSALSQGLLPVRRRPLAPPVGAHSPRLRPGGRSRTRAAPPRPGRAPATGTPVRVRRPARRRARRAPPHRRRLRQVRARRVGAPLRGRRVAGPTGAIARGRSARPVLARRRLRGRGRSIPTRGRPARSGSSTGCRAHRAGWPDRRPARASTPTEVLARPPVVRPYRPGGRPWPTPWRASPCSTSAWPWPGRTARRPSLTSVPT